MATASTPASRDFLRQLTLASGAPGSEGEVRGLVQGVFSGLGDVTHDRLGSVLCECTGTTDEPRVAIDAHMDEVAFLVQSVLPGGLLRFAALGGWWGHVLPAQRVNVMTETGSVPGIIASKPPHFLTKAEREKVQPVDELFLDVGATSDKQVAAFGIRVGDPILPHSEFIEMKDPDILSCKAFDDRAGVGVMCETMKRLGDGQHPNRVIGVGAVQEEVGLRGARTAHELARPDVALVLEGTPADDFPGAEVSQAVLGRGPQVRLFDPTAIANRRLVRLIEETAAAEDIPLQIAVRRTGGTNAGVIHLSRAGVPAAVIGVPARYIHTHVGLIHWNDYQAAVDLTTAVVRRLDAATVASLTAF